MANVVTMMLGAEAFCVPMGTFETLERSTRYRLDIPEPVDGQGLPVHRGIYSDTITLQGVVFPGYAGTQRSVQRFRDMATLGISQMLVDGFGNIYGNWYVSSIDERQSHHMGEGQPRRMEYTLVLVADPIDLLALV